MVARGNSNIRIGVLGGIGPEATGYFYLKLIDGLQKQGFIENNQDFPQIIINSINAPELIHDEIKNEDLVPYINGLKELDSYSVDVIAVVCNTIHLHYDLLQKSIKTPIVNLKEELKKYLVQNRVKKITVLGTSNTIKKLYRFNNIKTIDISERDIKLLKGVIFNFNRGLDKKRQKQIFKSIIRKYLDKGSQKIILGCTELSVIAENKPYLTDTIDILLKAVIKNLGRGLK